MLDRVWGGILSDRDISYLLESDQLVITPRPDIIQPVSVDLHLGGKIIIPRGGRLLDPAKDHVPHDEAESFSSHPLIPNEFVNVATLEHIELPPHVTGFLVGKSSLARMGLQVEAAGLVDPGWKGRLTLEVKNMGPDRIMLRPGMSICQLYLLAVFNFPCSRLYGDPALGSRYQHATGPETAKPSTGRPVPDRPVPVDGAAAHSDPD